jgi:hypothetical protein
LQWQKSDREGKSSKSSQIILRGFRQVPQKTRFSDASGSFRWSKKDLNSGILYIGIVAPVVLESSFCAPLGAETPGIHYFL